MVKRYAFERDSEDELIIVKSFVNGKGVNLILDSGASHSVIDFSILIEKGFRLGDTIGIVPISTANGIILANRFIVSEFSALGITKYNFEITSYINDDPEKTFEGILGLDFLQGTKFCIDLVENEITIDLKK